MDKPENPPEEGNLSRRIPVGSVHFGDLRRFSPISPSWGYDRGTPIDRFYIESFLARNAADVRGRVLELATNDYTRRFGGERVEKSDVLTVETNNSNSTIVGDLGRAGTLPEEAFDCIIFTQALHYIYQPSTALEALFRALKHGGVLLMTAPCIVPMADHPGNREEPFRWPWYWIVTPAALQRLLVDRFGQNAAAVEAHGNIFAATCFLYGLAAEELDVADLSFNDPIYPVTIAARAVKRTDV